MRLLLVIFFNLNVFSQINVISTDICNDQTGEIIANFTFNPSAGDPECTQENVDGYNDLNVCLDGLWAGFFEDSKDMFVQAGNLLKAGAKRVVRNMDDICKTIVDPETGYFTKLCASAAFCMPGGLLVWPDKNEREHLDHLKSLVFREMKIIYDLLTYGTRSEIEFYFNNIIEKSESAAKEKFINLKNQIVSLVSDPEMREQRISMACNLIGSIGGGALIGVALSVVTAGAATPAAIAKLGQAIQKIDIVRKLLAKISKLKELNKFESIMEQIKRLDKSLTGKTNNDITRQLMKCGI